MIKYNEFFAFVIKVVSLFLPPIDTGAKIRGRLFKPFMKSCGKNFMVPWRTNIFNPNKMSVGKNVYLGYNSYYGQGTIEIGDNVLFGPFVSVTPSNHVRLEGHFRNAKYDDKKIVIGDNVWLGSHCCILAGVKIGKGSVIGAGSVVTKDVPENVIMAGVPAKVIKKLNHEDLNS
jgi:maltose O-acetyltransferase